MILVIGATGNIGREVVKELAVRKERFKVLSRSPEKAKTLAGGEFVQGDCTKAESLEPAMRGVEKIFFVPAASPELARHHEVVVEVAKKAGAKQVVKVSVIGADAEAPLSIAKMHRDGETALEDSGLAWTHLRPGMFMSNWLHNAGSVKKDGAVHAPTGDGKIAPIDPKDIAEVGVVALTQGGHEGKAYTLTGPEALSFQQQCDILAKVIGKPVKHVDVPAEAAKHAMLRNGMPAWLVDGLLAVHAETKGGRTAFVSQEFEQVTGRKGRTIEAWFKENSAAFK
ncbi:MAG: SDR family oxidoreductase [Myxococcota bacterium]|nr:SDR family oxidoreductase [Myxococcota bacterium]